MLGHVRLG